MDLDPDVNDPGPVKDPDPLPTPFFDPEFPADAPHPLEDDARSPPLDDTPLDPSLTL